MSDEPDIKAIMLAKRKAPAIYPTATPMRRKVRDIYAGEEMSPTRCRHILAAHGIDPKDPILHSVHLWTEEERRYAANWAMREAYHASDNRSLRIEKPEWLKA